MIENKAPKFIKLKAIYFLLKNVFFIIFTNKVNVEYKTKNGVRDIFIEW